MLVFVAVMGECCCQPHIKFVRVNHTEPAVACGVAKRWLECASESDGWETGDCVVLPDDATEFGGIAPLEPDYVVPDDELPAWGVAIGDELYWSDPDEGACSRVIQVKHFEFKGDSVLYVEDELGCIEGYVREFSVKGVGS